MDPPPSSSSAFYVIPNSLHRHNSESTLEILRISYKIIRVCCTFDLLTDVISLPGNIKKAIIRLVLFDLLDFSCTHWICLFTVPVSASTLLSTWLLQTKMCLLCQPHSSGNWLGINFLFLRKMETAHITGLCHIPWVLHSSYFFKEGRISFLLPWWHLCFKQRFKTRWDVQLSKSLLVEANLLQHFSP